MENTQKRETRIVMFDPDKAEYIGDEQDGCYVQVQYVPRILYTGDVERHRPCGVVLRGHYVTVVVDCDSSGFVDDLVTDEGPFETHDEALEAGHVAATEWCLANDVAFD